MECRSLPGTCSKSITLLSVAALVLSFINVQTTTASLLNCNHNPSFIVIQTPGFARSSICTSAKIKSMALHSHHDKSDHDEHHSSSIVDMAIPILNNRLHQLRKQILENQIQKPPNPLLDPVQTISSILNELQQQPLTNKATDSHGNSSHDDYDNTRTKNQNYMSFLPDSGYRTLIRASTNTWKSALRKSIGAPENVTEEQFVSALQTAMSRPNNQYQILVSDSDIDVNVETTSSHGDDDDDNDNDNTIVNTKNKDKHKEKYHLYFPGDIFEYDEGKAWVESQLRHPKTGKLLAILGWSLIQREQDNAWIVDWIDWQDFRDEFRPGIGREEWDRICG